MKYVDTVGVEGPLEQYIAGDFNHVRGENRCRSQMQWPDAVVWVAALYP